MNKIIVKILNLFYPSSWVRDCAKCGRRWGQDKFPIHPTSESKYIVQLYSWPTTFPPNAGLALFCPDCDKIVTPEERWLALDAWKSHCISNIRRHDPVNLLEIIENISSIEFLEFPRAPSFFICPLVKRG